MTGDKRVILNHITERIGIHRVALCFLEKFDWIEREQQTADFGIDTQVEIVENEKPTGLLYSIQVKSGKSYLNHNTGDEIVYHTDERHINYWLYHSLPVLFIIYDPESDIKYWDFVTDKNTAKTNGGWKVKLPIKNQLDDNRSKDKIRGYYFSVDNFTIVESGTDTSHALSRRISMKIVLKHKTTSTVIIEDQLHSLVEGQKRSDYYRSKKVEDHFQGKLADCVFIYFYRDYEQYKNGLPFCTAYWNHPDSKYPTILSLNDKNINDIYIHYVAEEIPSEQINRRLPKGKYLNIVDHFLTESDQLVVLLKSAYDRYQTDNNFSQLKSATLSLNPEFKDLLPIEFRQNNAPLECADLHQKIQNIFTSIDNIFIAIGDEKRDEVNVIRCVELYLRTYAENINPAKYEREKVS